MSSTLLIENLISFNLTRQEATIYVALLTHGEMTGYEVAKETGMKEENIYQCENIEEVINKIKEIVMKDDIVYFKASNAMNFNKIIAELK